VDRCVYNLAYFWFYLTDFKNLKYNVITKSYSIHPHQKVKILDDRQETKNDSSHHIYYAAFIETTLDLAYIVLVDFCAANFNV